MNTAIEFPRMGPLTQGTIFSCGVAEGYNGCRIHGLIITARCDVAHDKVRTYNYLPVVSLDDWLHRDGRIILAERFKADTFGKLASVLREQGFSPSILTTETPHSILNTLFPDGHDNTQKNSRLRTRFHGLCEDYAVAVAGLETQPAVGICVHIAKRAPKLRDGVLSELASQRLSGYYFLDRVEPKGEDKGFVVLLREVRLLPRSLAQAVSKGLDHKTLAQMYGADPELRGPLAAKPDELAMPIGLLISPNVEHLMQSFSLLFGRIGIADPDPFYVAGLWHRQPSVQEAPK